MLAALLFVAQASAPALLTLRVEVTQLRNNAGGVLIALYDDAAGFPKNPEKAVRKAYLMIKEQHAEVTFKDLAPGEYAVAIIHDENANKKMDTNFIGMPKEGVGASNDAKGFMGPPKFKDAKFSLTKNDQTIVIPLHYL